MRTPREVLLDRHQTANLRLDQIRRSVIIGLPATHEATTPLAVKLWRELIHPCRHFWAGLAAIWILLTMVALSQSESGARFAASPGSSATDARLALQEKRRVLEEIIDPSNGTVLPTPSSREPDVQPRSARRPEFLRA